MNESNIDKFNEYVAKIFDYLYSEFPKETTVDPFDITGELEKERNEDFEGTMQFLAHEGFIRMVEKPTYGKTYYMKVALTSKGLTVLGASPDSLKNSVPFIQKLREALKSGAKEAVKATINGIISYSIKEFSGI